MTEWWKPLFQQTIDFYPGKLAEGMHACEQLLSVPGLPKGMMNGATLEEWIRRNQTWYARQLSAYGWTTKINVPHREGWSLFNPSIASTLSGELRMIVRSSNYRIDESGRYVMLPGEDGVEDGVIRTENHLVGVSRDFGSEKDFSWDPMGVIQTDHLEQQEYCVQGFEDARLFHHGRRWMFSATVRDRHPHGRCEMAVCAIDGGGSEPPRAGGMRIVSYMSMHEKNWMPIPGFDYSGGLKLMVNCYPIVVVDGNGRKGTWSVSPYIARSFRGGSQVIDFEPAMPGGKIAVVHESVTMEPYKRIYLHRFVLFDRYDDWTIAKISDPWVFEGWQIEFCAGMTQVGDDLVLSYGVNDAEAHLLRIPQSVVVDLLRDPLPEELS